MIIQRLVTVLAFALLFASACGDDSADGALVAEAGPAADEESAVEPTDDDAEEGQKNDPEADDPVEQAQSDDPVDDRAEDELAELPYDDPDAYYLVENLSPELGGFPEVREGAIVRGTSDAYVVDYTNCCTDDTLYATVTSLEDNAVFTIYAPDGEQLAVEAVTANLTLAQGGEYWIVVGATRGNAAYTIEMGLSQNAS